MKHGWLLALALALLVGPAGVRAQPEGPPPRAEVVTPPVSPSAQALEFYDQVNALMILRTLAPTEAQLQQVTGLVQSVRAQREALRQQAATLWQQSGPTVEQALTAWSRNQPPEAAVGQAAQAALTQAAALRASGEQQQAAAVQQFVGLLSPGQAALIESLPLAEQRHQTEAQLCGAASLADFLAQECDAVRMLGAEDYRAIRHWESQRLAALMLPPQALGQLGAAANAVARTLDGIMAMPTPQYMAGRAGLPAFLAQTLGLPAPGTAQAGRFTVEQVQLLLDSPETPEVLDRLQGKTPPAAATPATTPAATEQPAPAVPPDPWAQMISALDKLQTITVCLNLALTGGQMQALAPLVAQATAQGQVLSASPAQAVGAQTGLLQQMRDKLLASPQVPADVALLWSQLQQTRAQQLSRARTALGQALGGTRDYLALAQAALVNWPAVLLGSGVDPRARGQMLRMVAAEFRLAYDLFDELKYQRQTIYLRIRVERTEGFLERYLSRASPQWEPARSFALDLITKMKLVPNEQWEAAWPQIATDLLVAVGAIPSPLGAAPGTATLSWAQYSHALSHPQAPEVVTSLAVTNRDQSLPAPPPRPQPRPGGGGAPAGPPPQG